MSDKAKDRYVAAVKAALEDCDPKAVTTTEYVDALEELAGEVDTMLMAARESAGG